MSELTTPDGQALPIHAAPYKINGQRPPIRRAAPMCRSPSRNTNELQVLDAFGLQHGQEVRLWPNLLAGTAVFKLQRL